MTPVLAFEPQTVEEMLRRFPAALEPVFDPVRAFAGAVNGDYCVTRDRRHVFDFENGVRMIVTTERLPQRVLRHLSFGSTVGGLFALRDAELADFAKETLKTFGMASEPTAMIKSGENLHFWFVVQ